MAYVRPRLNLWALCPGRGLRSTSAILLLVKSFYQGAAVGKVYLSSCYKNTFEVNYSVTSFLFIYFPLTLFSEGKVEVRHIFLFALANVLRRPMLLLDAQRDESKSGETY